MKCELAPSVLSCDFGEMRAFVLQLVEGGADRIHFDVMDGQFVPPITFGAQLVKSLRSVGEVPFEAHLMTRTPEAHFEAFAEAGCSTIIFHAEATVHAHRLAQSLRKMGLKAGIAINPGTPACEIEPIGIDVDLALVMTVNPGWGGQTFIEGALEKVRELRRAFPSLDIEVDGGIDPQTLLRAKAAGANVFVAGSYLVERPTVAQSLRELRSACG